MAQRVQSLSKKETKEEMTRGAPVKHSTQRCNNEAKDSRPVRM